MKKLNLNKSELKKRGICVKVNKNLKGNMTYESAPQFIKDKIDKGRKMIAIAGLPK